MELLPLGPVVFIDTPGLDDEGELGKLRVERAYEVLRKTNMAVVVVAADEGITDFEWRFIEELKVRDIPLIIVLNKCDLRDVSGDELDNLSKKLGLPLVKTNAQTGEGIEEVKRLIIKHAKFDDDDLSLCRRACKSRRCCCACHTN